MAIAVLYFAALRELLGRSEEVVELPAGPHTIRNLADHLTLLHPELRPHLPSVRFAINESFVELGATVSSGDRVALLPPVSGG
jgi:molybdopterin synthase sulfur carrier subunit